MEKLKYRIRNASLRQSFILIMFVMVAVVVLLSGLTIAGCTYFRNWLLPDSNAVYLNVTTTYADGSEQIEEGMRMELGEEAQEISQLVEVEIGGKTDTMKKQIVKYSVDKIENNYTGLSPKRKLAYRVSGMAMIGLPLIYSLAGILSCGFWFYKRKLAEPIRILSEAAENITGQNLDFTIEYDCKDEMGALCESFEKMRGALYENNRRLWGMLEERKMLQASVAHDLRNPIAIIEGYTEYLKLNLQEGTMSKKQMEQIVSNLSASAKRMERYTDSIRDIHHLEELEIVPKEVLLPDLLEEIADDFQMMAAAKNQKIVVKGSVTPCKVLLDQQVLYRILENLITNAFRYAESEIVFSYIYKNRMLSIEIADDGKGFPDKLLQSKKGYLFTTEQSNEHMGMGLVISRILCKKHGGELKLENRIPHGAKVTIYLTVF